MCNLRDTVRCEAAPTAPASHPQRHRGRSTTSDAAKDRLESSALAPPWRPVRVDAHIHIFPPEVARDRERFRRLDPTFGELYARPRARLATAEDAIAELDRAGFDCAIAVGWGWRDPALCALHNDYLVDVARAHSRLLPFAAAQPADERSLDGVDRALAAGLRGIGELMPHAQGYDLDDGVAAGRARLAPLVDLARARGVPILTHVSEPVGHSYPGKGSVAPAGFLALAAAFPGQPFIAAHWGGGLPFYGLMPEVRAAMAAVWFDSAASPFLYQPEVYRVVATCIGVERILFGSDYPLLPIDRAAREVDGADLDAAERAAILGGNAARLLGFLDNGDSRAPTPAEEGTDRSALQSRQRAGRFSRLTGAGVPRSTDPRTGEGQP